MGKVYVLKKDYFDRIISQAPVPCVVKFTSAGCHLCHELLPVFKEVATVFNNNYAFFSVDVDKEEELKEEFSPDGVPTILIYNSDPRSGYEIPYPGNTVSGYGKEDLVEFLNSYGEG
jgi:thioredoxin-like negative regulator of GroEL|tara:strand:- start:562 stop:912 length:351 start_codon:yes stop_codon:yes gene_type:complete